MAARERNPWYQYRKALDPQKLAIGGLVFDYHNPTTRSPYRHPALSPVDAKKFVVVDELKDPWMVARSKGSGAIGGGLLNFAELDLKSSTARHTMVVGQTGSRQELIDPEDFLNNVVLQTYEGREWLSSRLAIANKLYIIKKLTIRAPRIWLVTGTQHIKDGKSFATLGTDSSAASKVSAPIPEPTGITALMNLTAGLHFKTSKGITVQAGEQVVGDKIYAAQYQMLDVKFSKANDTRSLLPNQITLQNVYSQGTARGEADTCELGLDTSGLMETSEADTDLYAQVFDEDYWRRFDAEAVKADAEA